MRRAAAIMAAVAELAGAARAEDLPDRRPMLRIEPGMHTAPTKSVRTIWVWCSSPAMA
ncbi:MAG: hypothetical protein ACLP7P_01530 [Rhodomicrobium sp.]